MSRSADRPPSFAVVIPMYNEQVGAERCVSSVLTALERLECRCTLIVVDDGSSDSTASILEQLTAHSTGLVVLRHPHNRGYGAGLMTGAKEALRRKFEYVLFMDSDLTNPPEDIEKFVDAMSRGIDVIKGSRFSKGGGMVDVPWKRQFMTRTARLISSVLFRIGVKDCTNGFRAIKTEIFTNMPLTERGFPIITEELYWAKRRGCTFANVPTTLFNRRSDQRPTLFAYNRSTMTAYLKHAVRGAFIHGSRSTR